MRIFCKFFLESQRNNIVLRLSQLTTCNVRYRLHADLKMLLSRLMLAKTQTLAAHLNMERMVDGRDGDVLRVVCPPSLQLCNVPLRSASARAPNCTS